MKASCIMPTRNRRPFVARAVAQFLQQDYADRELVVVDDGEDAIGDLLPADPRVRWCRVERRMSVGAKRNMANGLASGDVLLHWDDDDWMAPWRITYQVRALEDRRADVCGLSRLYFYDREARRAWQYVYPDGAGVWVAGGTLCYHRSTWRAQPFADVNEGEDTRFIWRLRGARVIALDDPAFYVASVHRGNTSRKRTEERRYQPCPPEIVERLMEAGGGA